MVSGGVTGLFSTDSIFDLCFGKREASSIGYNKTNSIQKK